MAKQIKLAEGGTLDAGSPEGLELLRHSTSHLMAQALTEMFPGIEITIGPATADGFYYDVDYERSLTPEDLEALEARMKEIVKRNDPVARKEMPREEAIELFKGLGQKYKVEIIEGIPEGETISAYSQGEFIDLCTGPHVASTGELGSFKLLRLAGAYWRGDEKNKMLQRIYGTAFPSDKELRVYLKQMEEAKKRDHRKLGKELDLFSIQDLGGGGLVFWHPKGGRIREVIEDYLKEIHRKRGYEFLNTPHVADLDLWKTSGHCDFYADRMYPPMEIENRLFQLKPMNCPFHILIYQNGLRSYRELPLRWAEFGTVYRHEQSGELHGLMRVRGFTQDDAHIFCRPDQLESEIAGVLDLMMEVLQTFGFNDFDIALSTRPDDAIGDPEIWEKATAALKAAIESRGLEYTVKEGDGAFYGPKIDIDIRDAIGRTWQCSTTQLDFNLPERFAMEFVGDDNAKHRPIMIHRALMGSMERFFGILIEHYAGAFPTWLAPEQVRVISITDEQADYARKVLQTLQDSGIRATADLRNEKLGLKIREAQTQKIPYALVIGDREMEEGKVAPRKYGEKQGLPALPVSEFVSQICEEIESRRA